MSLFNNNRLASIIIISLGIGLFILLTLDFAALHDIHSEYLSKKILKTLAIEKSKEVPVWTENKGEWNYLRISYILKTMAYAVLLVMAWYIYRKGKK